MWRHLFSMLWKIEFFEVPNTAIKRWQARNHLCLPPIVYEITGTQIYLGSTAEYREIFNR